MARSDIVDLDLSRGGEHLGKHVSAVPLDHLLPGIGIAFFVARDGFSARIPIADLLKSHPGVHAWIAVENPKQPWLSEGRGGIGPYALVWTGPGASAIGQEQWVDSLVSIKLDQGEADLPLPEPVGVPPADRAWSGRQIFAQNCLPCHHVAGFGFGNKGPDLVQPMSPAAYMTYEGFRALVRNPSMVRDWPARRMEGFSPAILSDQGIDDLWHYLGAVHKQP